MRTALSMLCTTALSAGLLMGLGANAGASTVPVTSGLAMQLDASNTASVVAASGTLTDGAAIKGWNDLSGNGNDAGQVTAGRQPTWVQSVAGLGGMSAIHFNTAPTDTQYLAIPTLSMGADTTVFIVMLDSLQGTTGSAHRALLTTSTTSAFSSTGSGYGISAGRTNSVTGVGAYGVSLGDGTSEVRIAFGNTATGDYRILGYKHDGTTAASQLTFDGVTRASGTQNHTSGWATGYTIGGDVSPGGGSRYYQGDVAEMLVYDRVLSPEEYNAVGYYLATKYNLNTTFIPAPAALPAGLTLLGIVALRRRTR